MEDNKRRENSIREHKRRNEERAELQKQARRRKRKYGDLRFSKKHMLVGAIFLIVFLGLLNLYGRSQLVDKISGKDRVAVGQQSQESTGEQTKEAQALNIKTETEAQQSAISPDTIEISKYQLPSQIKPEMLIGAIQARDVYNVPASLAIAQIIEESSGSYAEGLSELAYEYKNLFGVKGEGTAGSVSMLTNEYTPDGEKYTTYAYFAAYQNYADSLDHHGRILTMENYQNATTGIDWHENLDGWVRAIAIEYATSPEYGDSLVELIDRCGLRKFDSLTLAEL